MPNENRRPIVTIENTRFIFTTNFSGDPTRDNYGSRERKANIIIPTKEQADYLASEGFNVRMTRPRPGYEDEFIPEYYITIKLNYGGRRPPRVFMVKDGRNPIALDENTVSEIDYARISNVNVVCNHYFNEGRGTHSLYIQTMYVEVNTDYDPFADRYRTEAPFEV